MREASLWRLFARGFSSPQGPVQRWARRKLATAEACVAQAVALEVAVRTMCPAGARKLSRVTFNCRAHSWIL